MFHDPAILLKIESNRRLYKHYLTSLRSKFCNQNLINMTQKEFRQILRECIQEYIDNFDQFNSAENNAIVDAHGYVIYPSLLLPGL